VSFCLLLNLMSISCNQSTSPEFQTQVFLLTSLFLDASVFSFFQKHSSRSHVQPFVSPSTSSFLDTLTANLLTQIHPSGSNTIGTEQLRKKAKGYYRINPKH
jgi:hypothetical protein